MPEVYVIPDPLQMGLQLIVTALMLFVVRRFFWKPITKFIDDKKEISVSEINEAKEKNRAATELLDASNLEIKQARQKAAEIVGDSKKSANAVHESIIAEAKKEADYLKSNAKEAIEQEKIKFYDDLKNQVVDLSMIAAAKIIEEEIDSSQHERIVDNLIDGVS